MAVTVLLCPAIHRRGH